MGYVYPGFEARVGATDKRRMGRFESDMCGFSRPGDPGSPFGSGWSTKRSVTVERTLSVESPPSSCLPRGSKLISFLMDFLPGRSSGNQKTSVTGSVKVVNLNRIGPLRDEESSCFIVNTSPMSGPKGGG